MWIKRSLSLLSIAFVVACTPKKPYGIPEDPDQNKNAIETYDYTYCGLLRPGTDPNAEISHRVQIDTNEGRVGLYSEEANLQKEMEQRVFDSQGQKICAYGDVIRTDRVGSFLVVLKFEVLGNISTVPYSDVDHVASGGSIDDSTEANASYCSKKPSEVFFDDIERTYCGVLYLTRASDDEGQGVYLMGTGSDSFRLKVFGDDRRDQLVVNSIEFPNDAVYACIEGRAFSTGSLSEMDSLCAMSIEKQNTVTHPDREEIKSKFDYEFCGQVIVTFDAKARPYYRVWKKTGERHRLYFRNNDAEEAIKGNVGANACVYSTNAPNQISTLTYEFQVDAVSAGGW